MYELNELEKDLRFQLPGEFIGKWCNKVEVRSHKTPTGGTVGWVLSVPTVPGCSRYFWFPKNAFFELGSLAENLYREMNKTQEEDA